MKRPVLFGFAVRVLPPDDVLRDSLVEGSRGRAPRAVSPRELLASLVVGLGFFAVATPLAFVHTADRSPSLMTYVALVAAFTAATQVVFEVGPGLTVPTELFLVPMLFILPPGQVPLLVIASILLGGAIRNLRRGTHVARTLVKLGNAWYAVGPAAVLLAAGPRLPSWSDWPIYLAALGAQFALDFASGSVREWIAFGLAPLAQLRFSAWIWGVDATLAPAGLLAAFAYHAYPYSFALLLPLIGLLSSFALQHRLSIDNALSLSRAYRGTALLLGEMIKDDDTYTGDHSEHVVGLTLAVADEIGVSANERRNCELAALLHDVGKIRLPKNIVNKAGPLTPHEWQLVKQHTIEGEQMLARVGGLLTEIGKIVRSTHERWDGNGYPDGLAGEQIPLPARIIACCDAYSAMTTHRSYRPARAHGAALAELQLQAGSQFDPVVVEALRRAVTAPHAPAHPPRLVLDEPEDTGAT